MTPITLRIEQLRRARGWSQTELARRAGVRQATVSHMESGSAVNVNLPVLEKLAAALEVDPGYLLVHVPERSVRPSQPPQRPAKAPSGGGTQA